jgi:hypothetical protein
MSAHIRGRWDEYNFLFHHCVAGASHFYNRIDMKSASFLSIYSQTVPGSACAEDAPAREKSKQTKGALYARKTGKGLRGCVENQREPIPGIRLCLASVRARAK